MYMTASINNCLTAISSFVLSLIAPCFLPSAYYLYISSLLSCHMLQFQSFLLSLSACLSCFLLLALFLISIQSYSHAVMQSYTDTIIYNSFTHYLPSCHSISTSLRFGFLLFRFAALISALPLPNSLISALTTTGAVNRLVLFTFCREAPGFDVAHFAD